MFQIIKLVVCVCDPAIYSPDNVLPQQSSRAKTTTSQGILKKIR